MALGTIIVHGIPRLPGPVTATERISLQHVSKTLGNIYCSIPGEMSDQNGRVRAPLKLLAGFRRPFSEVRLSRLQSATDSNQIVSSTYEAKNEISEKPFSDSPSSTTEPSVSSISAAGKIQPETSDSETTSTRIQETANQSKPISEEKQQRVSSTMASMPKRSPLTAREKLRAVRILSKYNTVSKPSKPDLGNKVLDARRASDGVKVRSGLPETPTNLFDDLLIIIVSFVFISTVMFTTTYIVLKRMMHSKWFMVLNLKCTNDIFYTEQSQCC